MQLTSLLVVLVVVVTLFDPAASLISCNDFGNGDNYSAYEAMLLTDPKNCIELERGFFPVNYHTSAVVDIEYHFILDEKENNESNSSTPNELSNYRFRWASSPINLFMRPDLLASLSLYSYITRNISIDLYLGLPSGCVPKILTELLNASNALCYDPPTHLEKLNTLTANLQSYALQRSSVLTNGLQLDKKRGCSAYIFNVKPGDYCIMNQEENYSKQRQYMNIGCMLLVLAYLFAAPVILIAVYDSLNRKMKGNMLYFVWSIMTTSSIAAFLMVACDMITIAKNITQYPVNKGDPGYFDVFIYFAIFSFFLVCIFFGDLVVMSVALCHVYNRKKIHQDDPESGGTNPEEEFPIPQLLNFFLCGCCNQGRGNGGQEVTQHENRPPQGSNNSGQGEMLALLRNQQQHSSNIGQRERQRDQNQLSQCSRLGKTCSVLTNMKRLALLLGCAFFTLFLQVTSFHSVYVLLGTISTPVKTLSITSFYLATYFCFVAFVAVLLKSTDNKDYYKRETFSCCNLIKCICSFISAGLFITCAVLFVMYFYKYIILEHNNNDGFFGIIASALPPLLVALGGWCGTRMIKCVKSERLENGQVRDATPSA